MLKLPDEFVQRIKSQLKEEADAFLHSLNEAPVVSVRFNQKKNSAHLAGEKIPWCNNGIYLSERPSFTHDPLFHAGCYYVQEASSMFLEKAFEPFLQEKKNIHVLDLCAAPGGKSTHLLSLMNEKSLLVSNEYVSSRVGVLKENIVKWGNANVVVTNNEAKDFQQLEEWFDVIAADAPCSGEGLFRKNNDTTIEWTDKNIATCVFRQQQILSDVLPALKENGILIYSTCTLNPDENENRIQWLCENGMECVTISIDKSWGIEEIKTGKCIAYRFLSHRLKGEGFFISIMRKVSSVNFSSKENQQNKFPFQELKNSDELKSWLRNGEEFSFISSKEKMFALPKNLFSAMYELKQKLNLRYAGIEIAESKNGKMIPSHALSLSNQLNRNFFPEIELVRDDAIRFLKKEAIQISTNKTGFHLVTFLGYVLGFVNVLRDRINNYYPTELRIRK